MRILRANELPDQGGQPDHAPDPWDTWAERRARDEAERRARQAGAIAALIEATGLARPGPVPPSPIRWGAAWLHDGDQAHYEREVRQEAARVARRDAAILAFLRYLDAVEWHDINGVGTTRGEVRDAVSKVRGEGGWQ